MIHAAVGSFGGSGALRTEALGVRGVGAIEDDGLLVPKGLDASEVDVGRRVVADARVPVLVAVILSRGNISFTSGGLA